MLARLNDGRTSAAHEVHLAVDPERGLLWFRPIAAGASAPDPWPLERMRLVERTRQGARLTIERQDGARLQVDTEAYRFLSLHCPSLHRRPKARWPLKRTAVLGLLALAGLGGVLIYLLPQSARRMAAIMPAAIDRELGESSERGLMTMLRLAGKPVLKCVQPSGVAVLDRLTERLAVAGGLARVPSVSVLNSSVVNAFALPGERILLLSGILERAEGPAVVAGILGHEMGHVARHDPTEALIRNAGAGLLVDSATGDLFGNSSTGIASLMLTHGAYSREAERAADGFSLAALAVAGIDSAPLGRFYGRLGRDAVSTGMLVPTLLSTHPDPGDRELRVEREGRPGAAAMSDEDWAALLRICDRVVPPAR